MPKSSLEAQSLTKEMTNAVLYLIVLCLKKSRFFLPESKMLLAHITVKNHHYNGDHFSDRRVEMPDIDEKLEQRVVQEEIGCYQQRIAKQLYSPLQVRLRPDNVFRHQEACREGNDEREQESGNMRLKSYETKIEDLLIENKMKSDVIQHEVEHHVRSSANRIAKRLQRHQPPERRVKEVDKCQYFFSNHQSISNL